MPTPPPSGLAWTTPNTTTVRVSDLKSGDEILIDNATFCTVKAVEAGPHKDALTIRLRRHKPLQVAWNATVMRKGK